MKKIIYFILLEIMMFQKESIFIDPLIWENIFGQL